MIVILSIGAALLVGAMSPGPSFVVVVRTSVARTRKDGLATALGMGVGGVVFGALALAGLIALLSQVGVVILTLKLLGAAYLLHLAIQIWRHAPDPLDELTSHTPAEGGGLGSSFWLGLATQLSNPKTAIVYSSILAALLPGAPSLGLSIALLATIFLVESGWYALVAVAFSTRHARGLYLRAKPVVDRVASSVIGLLGVRLAVGATR